MTSEDEFEHITTDKYVAIFKATGPIFEGLFHEVRELSKKKPEAIMSTGKVKMINRVLEDLLIILKEQPTGKYLDLLDDATLPQMSDALLTMVQFNTALKAFRSNYLQYVDSEHQWITEEYLKTMDDPEIDSEDEYDLEDEGD